MIKKLLKAFLMFVGFAGTSSAQKTIESDECFSGSTKKVLEGLAFVKKYPNLATHRPEKIGDIEWNLIDGRYDFEPRIGNCTYKFGGAQSKVQNEIICNYFRFEDTNCYPFFKDFQLSGRAYSSTTTYPHLLLQCGMWHKYKPSPNRCPSIGIEPSTNMCGFKFAGNQ